jgi:membrane-associated protease RseP (regulator of RpoE activity)
LAVAPGSVAEQAGVRAGDVLRSIDGLSILTEAGAQRFARAGAGEEVRLAFERDSKPIAISLVLGSATSVLPNGPGTVMVGNGYMALNAPEIHGALTMEVWSDKPIQVQPIEEKASADSAGTMVLRIGDGTIVKIHFKKSPTDSTSGRAGRGSATKKPEPNL